MRTLPKREMQAVSGGEDVITVVGTRPQGTEWWEIQMIQDFFANDFVDNMEVQSIAFDGGGPGFNFDLSLDTIIRILVGEAAWRENHPNNDFDARDVESSETNDAGQTFYLMKDGSYWVDMNANGTPDTHVWETPSGAFYDKNMDGSPDTPVDALVSDLFQYGFIPHI